MIRINEIALSLDEDESQLKKKAAKILKINEKYIKKYTIYKKSIDARKKDDVHFTYSLDVNISLDEEQIASKCKSNKVQIVKPYVYELPENKRVSKFRPVVVGFGPAGMFAGLILALSGLKPIILERGKDVEARKADVQKFWHEKKLNEESNVQFGEGGAGTFSDGKLTTGIKSPFIKKILEELYEAGAPEEILYSSKPHIGTDRLEIVVKNIRKKIESLGGEVRLECKLTRLIVANKFVHGVTYEHKGESIDLDTVQEIRLKCFITSALTLCKSRFRSVQESSIRKSLLTRLNTADSLIIQNSVRLITSFRATDFTREVHIHFVCAPVARSLRQQVRKNV